eukprot:6168144-Pleurochrysis_carterae.AAC.1
MYREQVSDAWKQVVLERTAQKEFSMYSEDGVVEIETVPFGHSKDGNPLDESLNAEWQLKYEGFGPCDDSLLRPSCAYNIARVIECMILARVSHN